MSENANDGIVVSPECYERYLRGHGANPLIWDEKAKLGYNEKYDLTFGVITCKTQRIGHTLKNNFSKKKIFILYKSMNQLS